MFEFGLAPRHELRGFLPLFRGVATVGTDFDRCSGCSEAVGQRATRDELGAGPMYRYIVGSEGVRIMMLFRAFNETGFLEALTVHKRTPECARRTKRKVMR